MSKIYLEKVYAHAHRMVYFGNSSKNLICVITSLNTLLFDKGFLKNDNDNNNNKNVVFEGFHGEKDDASKELRLHEVFLLERVRMALERAPRRFDKCVDLSTCTYRRPTMILMIIVVACS